MSGDNRAMPFCPLFLGKSTFLKISNHNDKLTKHFDVTYSLFKRFIIIDEKRKKIYKKKNKRVSKKTSQLLTLRDDL